MMMIMKGHYADESGLLTPGTLMVDVVDGTAKHAELEETLKAVEYTEKWGKAIEINGIGELSVTRRFLPDPGECERCGITVETGE